MQLVHAPEATNATFLGAPLVGDLAKVAAARRFMDPTGHYNRPDIFKLLVDTTARQATTAAGNDADAVP